LPSVKGLDEQLRAAREAWPDIEVSADRFASEIQRRTAAMPEPGPIKTTDVYIAIACVDGNEHAIRAVRAILVREMEYAAGKTTASRDQLADAVASLSQVLFVDEPERPAALRDYSGRGDLKSYIRVAAVRQLARIVNRARREVGVGGDDVLLDRLAPASDPELSILRAQYRDVVDAAMRAALANLDERERAVLRYAFVEGWNVDRVGQAYNVHRATAARWISAARETLGKQIRKELAGRLKIGVDEIDSIIQLVQSRIDVSLDRVLR
jgi:RNA polymerase sigma-70 factor (ECF subfamily)